MTAEIEWADPPPVHGHAKYAAFWEALKANPGRWAKYPGKGAPIWKAKVGFEIVHRKGIVYCRYPLTPEA